MRAPIHEPHKIKTVRLVSFPTHDERKRHLAARDGDDMAFDVHAHRPGLERGRGELLDVAAAAQHRADAGDELT